MGRIQDKARSVAAGALVLGIAAVPVVWFVLDVRAGHSPSKFLWIASGVVLFAAGVGIVRGIGALVGTDEDTLTTASAIVAIVVTAGGLLGMRQWVHTYEPPLVHALGPACRGEPVPEAPVPGGARKVVVVGDDGRSIDWSATSAAWRAVKVGEADLVACVDRQDVSLEVCSYRAVPAGPVQSIERFQQVLTVRVVAAHTAEEVGTFTVTADPRACRKVETSGQGDLHGHVSFTAFSAELETIRTR